MKKFFKKYSVLAFWGSLIMMASAIEGENWGIAIISLVIFAYTCNLSKLVELEENNK